MKNLFLISALFVFSMAARASSHWNDYPRVGGYSVDQLCDAGENFQTRMAKRHCLKWEDQKNPVTEIGHGNEIVCTAWETSVVSVSKEVPFESCPSAAPPKNVPSYPDSDEQSCPYKVTGIRLLGNQFTVAVMEDRGELGSFEVSRFVYTIPACH